MKFVIKPEVWEKFPELFVYVPVITGFDNTAGKAEALARLREAEKLLRTAYAGKNLADDDRIRVHLEGFRDFGVDPEKMKPAHYALANRVLEGKALPDINPLTNLYNAMSIEFLTPFGGEDLSSLYGDFVLSIAQGGEQWIPIGGNKAKPAVAGELVWGDEYDLSTRALNWRQCERTKLTETSTEGYFIMDGFATRHQANVEAAAHKFVDEATKMFGGSAHVYLLDSSQREAEVPYQTKVWDKKRIFVEAKNVTQPKAQRKTQETVQILQPKLSGTDKILWEATERALEQMGVQNVSFRLEYPKDPKFGDYTTNAALAAAQKANKNPQKIAEELITSLQNDIEINRLIERIEAAGPGFINFYLKESQLRRQVEDVTANEWPKPLAGKKISVEYTDPNPFKEFHIGHLYSNLIGESIARLYEEAGATVWRADFYGDVGMHIAKSVWGMRKKMEQEKVSLKELEDKPIKERQQFMGQGYALGVKAYEPPSGEAGENEATKEEIKDINYMVYVASQEVLVKTRGWKPLVDYKQYIQGNENLYPQVRDIYQAGLKWSLAYFETYYARVGTKFDGYYPESWVGELGLKEVEKGLEKGVLTIGEEGAVVFEGEKYGYHTRVFRNKLGLPTYEAKDLGLVQAKYQDFPFDYSLNIFGKEIDEYYKVVKTAMELIDPVLGKKQEHLAHGMVNLPTGKMGSRHGNVITVEWLLNEARDEALKLIKNPELKANEKEEIAEQVGQAAVKYALLKSSVGDNVTFDFGQSVTFEGASGPYLQYTHARAMSVLSKAGKIIPSETELPREILQLLTRYGSVISEAAAAKSPSTLAVYLYNLAQKFNSFYNRNRIGNDSQRLWLTRAVAAVLKQGLQVLGIAAPSTM